VSKLCSGNTRHCPSLTGSRAKLWIKFLRTLVIFLIIFTQVFSGWPGILLYAQEEPLTPETATSTPSDDSTSTLAVSLPTEGPAPTAETEEEELIEEEPPQPEPQSDPAPQPLSLKKRKIEKEIHIDKNARHSCAVKGFTVNISGHGSVISELELNGERGDSENIEIGSLPLGVDITFLNNADYVYSPSRNEGSTVLQINNQSGSQKGNFSIVIIYTSGNSTTICQINVINF